MTVPLSDNRYITESMKHYPIQCPYLLILAKRSHSIITDLYPILDEIKTWKNATIIALDVDHDMHMNNPELVAPIISEFMTKIITKL